MKKMKMTLFFLFLFAASIIYAEEKTAAVKPADEKAVEGKTVEKKSNQGKNIDDSIAQKKTDEEKNNDAKNPDSKAPDSKTPDVKAADAKAAESKSAAEIETPPVLKKVEAAVNDIFKKMDDDLKLYSDEIAQNGIKDDRMNEILSELVTKHPYSADCGFVTPKGILKILQPKEYKKYENKDISKQEHIVSILKNKKPILSKSFISVEGFNSIDVEYPIIAKDKYLGSLSILLRPKQFLYEIIVPAVKGIPGDIMVMEQDGTILYDIDDKEIGRNTFTDELYKPYPGLIKMAKQVAAEEKGTSDYDFLDTGMKEKVTKTAYWTTVNIYERKIKIVLTKKKSVKSFDMENVKKTTEALNKLSGDEKLLSLISEKKNAEILKVLEEFYNNNQGIYNIQFADETFKVVSGYPEKSSLKDFQFNVNDEKDTGKFIKAIKDKKPAQLEEELFEGGMGYFVLCPVFVKDNFKGTIYMIFQK